MGNQDTRGIKTAAQVVGLNEMGGRIFPAGSVTFLSAGTNNQLNQEQSLWRIIAVDREGLPEFPPVTFIEDEERRGHVVQEARRSRGRKINVRTQGSNYRKI